MLSKLLEKMFGAMLVVITMSAYMVTGAYLRMTGEFKCLLKGCADRVGSSGTKNLDVKHQHG